MEQVHKALEAPSVLPDVDPPAIPYLSQLLANAFEPVRAIGEGAKWMRSRADICSSQSVPATVNELARLSLVS